MKHNETWFSNFFYVFTLEDRLKMYMNFKEVVSNYLNKDIKSSISYFE